MTDSTRLRPGHEVTPRSADFGAGASHFQWRVVDIPRSITRAETRQLLSEQAEYGRWELARTQVFIGGSRRVWLRRRVLRVERSDAI